MQSKDGGTKDFEDESQKIQSVPIEENEQIFNEMPTSNINTNLNKFIFL